MVIDLDHRGEIKVSLHNDDTIDHYIVEGERIAQLIIMPFVEMQMNEVEELDDTARSDGGFGSTGYN